MKTETTQYKKLPRMRTIKEAAAEIKAIDQNSAVTEFHIRQLAINGIIPTVKAGKKILLNLDVLFEYLTDPNADKFCFNQAVVHKNNIRKLS